MSGVTPLWRRSGQWPAGTAWSPIRGDVGPGAVDVAGNQAGVPSVYCLRPGIAFHGPSPVDRGGDRGRGPGSTTRVGPPTRHTGAVATRPQSGSIPDEPGS